MTPGDQYRRIAAEFRAKAKDEAEPDQAAQWIHLAKCYARLAEQADHNSLTDIAVEFVPKPSFEDDGT